MMLQNTISRPPRCGSLSELAIRRIVDNWGLGKSPAAQADQEAWIGRETRLILSDDEQMAELLEGEARRHPAAMAMFALAHSRDYPTRAQAERDCKALMAKLADTEACRRWYERVMP